MITEKTTFLIGNGINQAIEGERVSWGNLLSDLQNQFDVNHIDLKNPFKPFPLSFEEILFASSGSFDLNIRSIKDTIASTFRGLEPNLFHKRIMNSERVDHILTPNYDYAFEKVFVLHFFNDEERLENATTETKHSIRRRCYLGNGIHNKSIWHIHGELNHNQNFTNQHYSSESIQIGFDHYVEYLIEIQNYLKGRKYKEEGLITEKIRSGNTGVSWLDKFFFGRLVIVGLGMDFSEIDLWWVLNYRSKVFKRFADLQSISNSQIVFYDSNLPKRSDLNKEEEKEYEIKQAKKYAVEDVLTSLGVNYESILCSSYKEFYEDVFHREGI